MTFRPNQEPLDHPIHGDVGDLRTDTELLMRIEELEEVLTQYVAGTHPDVSMVRDENLELRLAIRTLRVALAASMSGESFTSLDCANALSETEWADK